jgi:hypothetical protein
LTPFFANNSAVAAKYSGASISTFETRADLVDDFVLYVDTVFPKIYLLVFVIHRR